MGDDHGAKLVKSLRGAAQKYVGVGFFLGFFLVLLTYFTLSEQFAIAAPNGASRPPEFSLAFPWVHFIVFTFFFEQNLFLFSLLHALSGQASICDSPQKLRFV